MGPYAHGNQPIQQVLHLCDYAGQPWKTQPRVRAAMNKLYAPEADGYCGDEDNGQTSAWYVFSALGFYPVCPGDDLYIIGTPLFDQAVLNPNSEVTAAFVAGSTGHWPVPSGDSPLGMATSPELLTQLCYNRPACIPSGQWPDGTGRLRVLPDPISEFHLEVGEG